MNIKLSIGFSLSVSKVFLLVDELEVLSNLVVVWNNQSFFGSGVNLFSL